MRLCVLGFRYTCFCTVVGTRCQLTNKATEALILHFSFLSRCYLAGRLFDINSLVAFITFGCWHRHLTFPYLRPSSRHRTDSRDCGTQEDRAFMTLAYLKNGSIWSKHGFQWSGRFVCHSLGRTSCSLITWPVTGRWVIMLKANGLYLSFITVTCILTWSLSHRNNIGQGCGLHLGIQTFVSPMMLYTTLRRTSMGTCLLQYIRTNRHRSSCSHYLLGNFC